MPGLSVIEGVSIRAEILAHGFRNAPKPGNRNKMQKQGFSRPISKHLSQPSRGVSCIRIHCASAMRYDYDTILFASMWRSITICHIHSRSSESKALSCIDSPYG